MEEKVLGHLEFWTQFQQYLTDQSIQLRVSKPSKTSSSNLVLRRSYFSIRPWRLLKDNKLGVSVRFTEPGATTRFELIQQQYRLLLEERLSPLGTLEWKPAKISLSRATTPKAESWQERNAWMAGAIQATCSVFNEICPPQPPLNLEFRGNNVVNSDTGEEYNVLAIAARLPWQAQLGAKSTWEDYPPYMPPHEFVVLGKCDYADWDVLCFACTRHTASYLGYFRGYQNAMRYWEPGDGYRYWPSAQRGIMMLNRCTLDSVEPPRRVDRSAKPIKPKDWGAPPWLPQGNGWPPSYLKKNPKLARELGIGPGQ